MFQINEEVARAAVAELGVKLPIHVEVVERLGLGVKGDMDNTAPRLSGKHLVRVARNPVCICGTHTIEMSIADHGEGFLHELRHCAQLEKLRDFGRSLTLEYTIANRQHGYDDNPFERDARAWAEEAIRRYPNIIEAI